MRRLPETDWTASIDESGARATTSTSFECGWRELPVEQSPRPLGRVVFSCSKREPEMGRRPGSKLSCPTPLYFDSPDEYSSRGDARGFQRYR
jgi:hypothetical protein